MQMSFSSKHRQEFSEKHFSSVEMIWNSVWFFGEFDALLRIVYDNGEVSTALINIMLLVGTS